MSGRAIQLEGSWLAQLENEFQQPYMLQLREFLRREKQQGKRIFPAGEDIFNAFTHTPLGKVKVVILGQDPYHGEGQAHGLCFSVKPGVRVPPSLQNIFKEIHAELEHHVERPVNWTASVQAMVTLGADTFVELGAGNVLAGLIKRIDRSVRTLGLGDLGL